MRSLFNILESIADSDEETVNKSAADLVPYKLVDIFLSVFPNMYVDHDSHYDRNSDYVAGRLRLSEDEIYDRAFTENTLKTNIRKYIKLVKKEFPKADCSMKTRDTSVTFLYQKNFGITMSIDGAVYGMTICLVGTKLRNSLSKRNREVDYIRILVGNDEIKEAFHNKVK